MLSGIEILCFATSYSVSLVLEVTRLLFRASARIIVMLAFAVAGFVAHTIYLTLQAREGLAAGQPLSSWYDWCLFASWVLVAAYLVITISYPRIALGVFLLPLVLALIGLAYLFQDVPAFSPDRATRLWGMFHGMALLLGTVAVAMGFVAGVMYLVQAYRLKQKLPPRSGLELPSLEWLQFANSLALVVSSFLLVLGLVAGTALNLVKYTSDVPSTPWNDSVVWGSGILLLWLIAALLFNWLYKPARQGRKVAYLTVASFLFVILAISMALSAQHASRIPIQDDGRRTKVDFGFRSLDFSRNTGQIISFVVFRSAKERTFTERRVTKKVSLRALAPGSDVLQMRDKPRASALRLFAFWRVLNGIGFNRRVLR